MSTESAGGLFAAEETEAVVEETTPETQEQTDKDLFADSEEKVSEETPKSDDLFDDEDSEEEEEETPSRAQERIQKLVAKRREEVARRVAAEEKLDTFRELQPVIDELYGDYKSPLEEMRYDHAVTDSFVELAKENPVLKQLAADIHEYITKGTKPDLSYLEGQAKETKVSESKATSDPRVDRIVKAQITSELTGILEGNGVRPELRGAISKHVLNTVSVDDFSPAAVKDAVKGFIIDQGWSREFVSGEVKEKRKALPSKGPGTVVSQTKTPAKSTEASPKTISDWEEDKESSFRALFATTQD